MKKKLLLLTTFLISFIVFSNSVMAAQELTCTYKKFTEVTSGFMSYTYEYQKQITQDSDGNIKYYALKNEGVNANTGYAMNKIDNPKLDYSNTEVYDNSSKTLQDCPPCIKKTTKNNDFTFSDLNKKGECKNGYLELETKKESVESDYDISCLDTTKEEAQKKIESNIYLSHCSYKENQNEVTIYFNKKEYTVTGSYDSIHSCISITALNALNHGYCPRKIYHKGNTIALNSLDGALATGMTLQSRKYFDENGNELKLDDDDITNLVTSDGPESCSELFSEELISEINKVMNIVRIAVPILLLAFGITDFFRATFANGEEDIKKARDRFIKRIIAAIIVFIVPIFVNLVLKISNTVWGSISPDTCIDKKEAE